MKVKIGKYPSRLVCNLYSDYMTSKYGYDYPENNKFESVLEWVEDQIQKFYNIFNKIYFDRKTQKISVKLDPWDTWSADSTLAYIIAPMLKQLKETKHGAPHVDDEDVPDDIRSVKDKSTLDPGEIDKYFFNRWDYVLDEMIWAFEQDIDGDWESQYYTFSEDTSAPFGFSLDHTDEIGLQRHYERIKNGHRLFGKYYSALWD